MKIFNNLNHWCFILAVCFKLSFVSVQAQTKILWAYGDNFGGYENNGIGQQTDIKILSHSYYSPVRYEGMKAMDLRLSVDTALCKVHLNKVQITGAWNGGPSALKPVKTRGNAFYNAADQTLNVESDAKIEVFGLDGVLRAVSSNRPVFSVATLSRGVYIARITTEKGQTVLKFVR